jgi:hypothetical protein
VSDIYHELHYLLQKYPSLIHAVDGTGQTALHVICSNRFLVSNIKLIQLFVEASEILVDHDVEGKSKNYCNNEKLLNEKTYNKIRDTKTKEKQNIYMEKEKILPRKDKNDFNVFMQRMKVHISIIKPNMVFRDNIRTPSPAILLRTKSIAHGQLPLHVACQNIDSSPPSSSFYNVKKNQLNRPSVMFFVLEYLIRCHPAAICTVDRSNRNLPLHYACMVAAATPGSVSLELIILLVQQWPDACKVRNRDGNLPLHLAAQLLPDSNITDGINIPRNSSFEQKKYFENRLSLDIDTLEDILLELSDDDSDDDEHDYLESQIKSPTSSQIKLPKSVQAKNKQNQQAQYNQYQNQLEIVQYLMEVYPEGLHFPNKAGLTPCQVAVQSVWKSNDHKTQSNVSSKPVVRGTLSSDDEMIPKPSHASSYGKTFKYNPGSSQVDHKFWEDHPVIKFLRNPTKASSNNSTGSSGDSTSQTAAISIVSDQDPHCCSPTKSSIGKVGWFPGCIDSSGRGHDDIQYDDPKINSPWRQSAHYNIKRKDLMSPSMTCDSTNTSVTSPNLKVVASGYWTGTKIIQPLGLDATDDPLIALQPLDDNSNRRCDQKKTTTKRAKHRRSREVGKEPLGVHQIGRIEHDSTSSRRRRSNKMDLVRQFEM